MHPIQIAVLLALVSGVIIYIWYQIRRDVRAEQGSDGAAFLTPARFEVRDVFEITNRGRVVSGEILAGKFRMGTRVWAEHMPGISFTISGVEFLDDIANHRAWVTFVSEDAPGLTELRQVLSAGSILTDVAPAAGGT